jgi:molybdopterin-guanine dinucleotide biosynthesis protein A
LENKYKATGIILSGGKSIRMGENKAFIEIEGVPIILRVYNLLKQLFQETIIVTNQKELFLNFDSKIYSDLLPNKGALGGLYTGIFFSAFNYSFCVACDMPFIKKPVVEHLMQHTQGDDVIVPRTKDGLQPLHAIYSKNCLEPIKLTIEQGKYKIIDFYEKVKLKIVPEDDFISLDPLRESFVNVNTPIELLSIRRDRKQS